MHHGGGLVPQGRVRPAGPTGEERGADADEMTLVAVEGLPVPQRDVGTSPQPQEARPRASRALVVAVAHGSAGDAAAYVEV